MAKWDKSHIEWMFMLLVGLRVTAILGQVVQYFAHLV